MLDGSLLDDGSLLLDDGSLLLDEGGAGSNPWAAVR